MSVSHEHYQLPSGLCIWASSVASRSKNAKQRSRAIQAESLAMGMLKSITRTRPSACGSRLPGGRERAPQHVAIEGGVVGNHLAPMEEPSQLRRNLAERRCGGEVLEGQPVDQRRTLIDA
ncbi:MAG TPA: hypothetical protein VNB06_19355, partial [Thermoanaerobaculia bacterium]|nr:hypothetical protein [Thermoanaerobaculia bacterium]